MIENKNVALTGASNKRLNNKDLRNNQNTSPLVDTKTVTREARLTLPPEEDVIHAKEWVDDGSIL